MSVFKLAFAPLTNATRRKIIECSDQDFVIMPDFLPIEVIRRKKYDGGSFNLNYTQNLLYYQRATIDKITDSKIDKMAEKAWQEFPKHNTFYLITKPKNADFNRFVGWVNSLKP